MVPAPACELGLVPGVRTSCLAGHVGVGQSIGDSAGHSLELLKRVDTIISFFDSEYHHDPHLDRVLSALFVVHQRAPLPGRQLLDLDRA